MADKFRVIEGGGEKRDMAQSMLELGREARRAARQLALAPRQRKNAALMVAAGLLRTSMKDVLEANARDMEAATAANASKANLDRLLLTEARVEAMAKGLEDIAALPDPVGRVLATYERPNGLSIERVATPLGVIGVIYESRPNVTADAGALCLKAGNAAILRGGSDSFHSSRTIVELLGAVTDEGYVFRVDLRLRPAAEVTPLALPFIAAITHYESSALAWERAAFIRARPASGDIAAGQAFLDAIRPFVWRRSLDFGAIAEIGRLTTRIRDHYAGGQAVGPGYDLKRGRGGIREVEFFAQTHQLIHGGRNPALRLRGTRAALDALADAGIVAPEDAALLGTSYDRLRTIEHRLQMIADQQTHSLPTDAAQLDAVAHLDGLPSGSALVEELARISEAVGSRFDTLIATYAPTGAVPVTARPLELELAALGFADPGALAVRIESWDNGQYRALRSAEARAACTGDAFRLCASEIPSIPKITVCMRANKAKLSAPCRAVMEREDVPEASPVADKPQ